MSIDNEVYTMNDDTSKTDSVEQLRQMLMQLVESAPHELGNQTDSIEMMKKYFTGAYNT